MRFRKGKCREYLILKLMGGQWEFWDGEFKTEQEAKKQLGVYIDDRDDEETFIVVKAIYTQLPKTKRHVKRGGNDR